MTYNDFLTKIKKYLKHKKDIELIDKAYNYAKEKHIEQKRDSGEDFIIHPLNVAYLLSDIFADKATICAALLHDVIEDCNVKEEEIKESFGEEIAKLVMGVTRINEINVTGSSENKTANQRKILVGMTEDVRVIIIKLADRLHNMRTLWSVSEARQKVKAKETLDIYVPIAHRLGISTFKSELEDLSLRYLKPDVYFNITEKMNKSKTELDDYVQKMKESISELIKTHHVKHEIKGRSKSIFSIYKKLEQGRPFSDIYDILALRVYVNTEAECYQVLGVIHAKYRPIPKRFRDFIAMPKTNMYQSLHTTVFGIDGQLFEIQIRTYEMDKIAEAGIASHWSYKEKGKKNLQSEMEQKLQFFKFIMDLKQDGGNDSEFVESVTEDVFKDTIYVYTPQGDVVEMPNGATPIDFAYRVHSKVGDTMVGAIVNGAIVPLDYQLKENDIIKINTNKTSTPNREWLNIAKTAHAKNKIRSFINRTTKSVYSEKGEELLNKELRKKKIAFNDFFTPENINKIKPEFKCADLNELYISLGNNKLTAHQVVDFIFEEKDTKEENIIKKTENKKVTLANIKNDIIVEGIDNIKVNIAACCKPIWGDKIIGYITKGHGITVHRLRCPNVSSLQERFINVFWNENVIRRYPTGLLIKANNDKTVLSDIVSKTAGNDITVEKINTIKTGEEFMYELIVTAETKEKLLKYKTDLESIASINSVERLIT